jgi:hypothetical protein
MSHEGKIKVFEHNSQLILNNCSGQMHMLADGKLHDQGFTVETTVTYVSAFFSSQTTIRVLWWRDSGKHKLILLNVAVTGKEYDGHMTFEGRIK